MPVYVVVSVTISYGQTFHGVHGVYKSKDAAQVAALSSIIAIVKNHGYSITKNDITIDEQDFIYTSNKTDVVVSCIKQYMS